MGADASLAADGIVRSAAGVDGNTTEAADVGATVDVAERGDVAPDGSARHLAPLYAAWVVALAATLGALFVGEVMGQMPCVLCWYQRIAMIPLAVVLGIAASERTGACGSMRCPSRSPARGRGLPCAALRRDRAGSHRAMWRGPHPARAPR